MTSIQNMLMNRLDDFGIHHKLVHLVNRTSVLLVFVMFRMLIIHVAIFLTTLLDQTNTVQVMMMKYNGRQQQRARCHP